MMEGLIHAMLLLLLTGPLAWSDTARGCLEAMDVPGEVQIKYADKVGRHALYFDNRFYFPQDLPFDAKILVLRGDAVFSCGGARIDALPGTIFTAGVYKGMEYVYLRAGELTITIGAQTTTLDSDHHTFSFVPSASKGPLATQGILR